MNTPNLLNEYEMKKFAICWLDGRITVRTGGLSDPMIMEWQNPYPIGISYFGVRTSWGATGKWKLQIAQNPNHKSNLPIKFLFLFLFFFVVRLVHINLTSLVIEIINYWIACGCLKLVLEYLDVY